MNTGEQIVDRIGFVNDSLTLTSRAQEKAGCRPAAGCCLGDREKIRRRLTEAVGRCSRNGKCDEITACRRPFGYWLCLFRRRLIGKSLCCWCLSILALWRLGSVFLLFSKLLRRNRSWFA